MTALVSTRFGNPKDVELIVDLIKEVAIYEKLGDFCVTTPQSIKEAFFSTRPVAEVLIGELNGNAAGLAIFFNNYSTFLGKNGLHLEDLFVRPYARGSGVGTALVKAVAKIAAERDCARIEWFVLDWNAPAIGFFRSLGATAMDEFRVFRMNQDAIAALAHAPFHPSAQLTTSRQ